MSPDPNIHEDNPCWDVCPIAPGKHQAVVIEILEIGYKSHQRYRVMLSDGSGRTILGWNRLQDNRPLKVGQLLTVTVETRSITTHAEPDKTALENLIADLFPPKDTNTATERST